jgi:glycerol-3-phosphate acyltransferase PlsY
MQVYKDFGFLAVLAYLLGSVPSGKLVGKLYGVDIQKRGSGNIGFANVRRTLGWTPAIVVLVGDVAKAFIPVFIAKHYLSVHQVMAVALLVLAGNIFPVWLRFKGGKGIATGLGISLAISPWLGLVGGGIYVLAVACFKKSAASSLIATAGVVAASFWLARSYFALYIVFLIVSVWTHRDNIKRMLKTS